MPVCRLCGQQPHHPAPARVPSVPHAGCRVAGAPYGLNPAPAGREDA